MGINYYVKTKKCTHCGHEPRSIHIGKSSGGWKFSFQYNNGQYYKTADQLKNWIEDNKLKIIDEYGKSITLKKFWNMVQAKQDETYSHGILYQSDIDFEIEGYSFTNCEFS